MALGMEVGLGPGHIVLDGKPVPLPRKWGRATPQFSAHFYCLQTVGCIKMPVGMEVGLSPGDFVLDGDPASPLLKGHSPPNFWPMSVVAKRLDGLRWHLVWRYRPRPRRLCVRWRPSYLLNRGHTHHHPVFGPCLCGQTAGWMKTPLGTEVDLGPGQIVLDGVLAVR